jgi:hypothetical protein
MSNGAYVATNPRTITGAKRKGWHVVEPVDDYIRRHNVSWLGLVIWTDRNTDGHYLNNYSSRQFAFERVEDASKFLFMWGLD